MTKIQFELTEAEKNALMDVLDEVEELLYDETLDFVDPEDQADAKSALQKLILALPACGGPKIRIKGLG